MDLNSAPASEEKEMKKDTKDFSLDELEQLNALSITDENAPPDIAELPASLKDQECFYTWMESSTDSKIQLKSKQKENEGQTKGGIEVALTESEGKVYEVCHLLFHLTETKDYEKADKAANELSNLASKIISEGTTALEITEGYLYVTNYLQGYLLWKKGESEKLASHLDNLKVKNFHQLSKVGQITVMRLKIMAYQHFRLTSQFTSMAEQLAELEPENSKWFYYMYFYYRDVRRKVQLNAPPEERELNAISKALALEPDNFVYIVAGFQNLSERVRYFNNKELENNPITWAGKEFSSVETIVNYMKGETRLLLKYSDRIPGYAYIILGEIFSSCLSRPHLDFQLAEKCIRKALDVTPGCTRTNHRMGVFLWKTAKNFQSAVTYLQRASQFSSQNFHARTDLIHLLLSKPEEQQEVLKECFDTYLNEDGRFVWDSKEVAELKFLKGCFILMINGNKSEVVRCWIDAYDINPSGKFFVEVYSQSRRFHWNYKDFNFSRCKDVVVYALDKSGLNNEQLNTVTNISDGILKGVQILESNRRFADKSSLSSNNPSEADKSWRSNRNRSNNSLSEGSSNSRHNDKGYSRGYDNSHSRPFRRNSTNSGSEESNWRK